MDEQAHNYMIMEQEVLAWKHTAEVYEQRYEAMRHLVFINTVVCTAITGTGVAIVLILLLLSR